MTMNRRDFLKALGLATGAALVPAGIVGSKAVWPAVGTAANVAVAEDTAKWGDICIDGRWFTLDGASIEMWAPPTETTRWGDKFRTFTPGVLNWRLEGRSRSEIPGDLVFGSEVVDVIVSMAEISSSVIRGRAMMTSTESNVTVNGEIMNAFVLYGAGPLVRT